MMPQINVSQTLFDKLKALAEPFVDTPESVVTKCVDFYAANRAGTVPSHVKGEVGGANAMAFPPDGAPPLTFTRPLSIKLEGVNIEKKGLYWNALMLDVVAKAAAALKSPEKLKQMILVNYVEGEGPQDKGYRYVPEANLSVQLQDSNAAWKATIHIIKAMRMNVDVVFMWELKEKAVFPGKTGRMKYEAV
jgi:hypothetical protein